jgi:hypothetical protein
MMESRQPATEVDRRKQERAAKEQTDKEIAERVSAPPPMPTPTQAEADALKEGEAIDGGSATQTRDVKPGASGAGYTTR